MNVKSMPAAAASLNLNKIKGLSIKNQAEENIFLCLIFLSVGCRILF